MFNTSTYMFFRHLNAILIILVTTYMGCMVSQEAASRVLSLQLGGGSKCPPGYFAVENLRWVEQE